MRLIKGPCTMIFRVWNFVCKKWQIYSKICFIPCMPRIYRHDKKVIPAVSLPTTLCCLGNPGLPAYSALGIHAQNLTQTRERLSA